MSADRRLCALSASAALAALLVAGPADADEAAAEALFRDGRQLIAAGNIAEACEKFAESNRLDSSPGTLLNLADCHVKMGRTASAWAEFLAAARLSRAKNEVARADEATKRAQELEAGLSSIVLRITRSVAGLEVKRDDVVLHEGAFGAKIPTDPGPHVISVAAPGFKPWVKNIVLGGHAESQEIVVPALEEQPTSSPAPARTSAGAASGATGAATAADAELPTSKRSPVLGYVIGGTGVALAGVGAYFGVSALSAYKRADDLCPSHTACPREASDQGDDARAKANLANVGIGLGIVGIGVGTYLVLTSKGDDRAAASTFDIAPAVGASYAGAAARGTF